MTRMRPLVIIPTYNEAENIERILHRIAESLPEAGVLVVDDGSPDGTGDIVKSVAAELPAARDGDVAAAKRLAEAGRNYVALIRQHIMKEDRVLFGMADQMIAGPACRTLCAAYDDVCQHRFDGRTVEELEAILERLQARYPAA